MDDNVMVLASLRRQIGAMWLVLLCLSILMVWLIWGPMAKESRLRRESLTLQHGESGPRIVMECTDTGASLVLESEPGKDSSAMLRLEVWKSEDGRARVLVINRSQAAMMRLHGGKVSVEGVSNYLDDSESSFVLQLTKDGVLGNASTGRSSALLNLSPSEAEVELESGMKSEAIKLH